MKNFKFLFGAFCALGMMASCSSSDDAVEGGGTTPDNSGNLYLSVNVMSSNTGTRATETGEPGTGSEEDPKNSSYEKGTETENTVTSAVFYFFTSTGEPANVVNQNGTMVNYYSAPVAGNSDNMPNEEKILTAQVVINTKQGDQIPDKMVAILNATPTDNSSKSLSQLAAVTNDYRLAKTEKKFVMSSSVYSKDGEKKMEVEDVKPYFKSSETEAQNNPVDVYVERVLAKVSVASAMTYDEATGDITVNGEKLYYTDQTSDKSGNADKRLYVKFVGWDVATETAKSYLFKNINAAWSDADLGIVNWTWPNYYRSFWAMNPALTDADYENHTFGNATKKVGSLDAKGDMIYGTTATDINYTYIQENANPNSTSTPVAAAAPTKPTKIVVAAQLVDKNGNAVTLAEWKGVRTTKDGVLMNMANLSTIYYSADGGTTRTKITPDMICFPEKTNIAVLTDAVKNNTSYTFYLTSGTEAASVDVAAVNTALKNLGAAKIWEEGKTYYFTDIRHLATSDGKPGYIGIVRNHSYQVALQSVTGLGTPVYNPDEVIVPENPDMDESYLAARIKVLSWRVVKSTVDLK